LRLARRDRGRRIDHGGQRFVIDGDPLGRVARRRQALGHHEGHRVADEADPVVRQRRPWRRHHRAAVAARIRHLAGQTAEPLGSQLRPGQHREHAGGGARRGRVDGPDARMGMRRAQHVAVGLPVEVDVVGIAAGAGDEAAVFLAPHRPAHAELAHVR
jgi:hypothetical protein